MRIFWTTFLFASLAFVTPALAGGDGGHGFALKEHGFYILNFLIFMGILVGFARKPIKEGLANRADEFAHRLDKAREEFEATQSRLEEARTKVDMADVEGAALMARVEEESEQLKASIAAKTDEEEKKVRAGARAALENEKKRLERRFQGDLALAALGQAETELESRWQSLPHAQFVEQFADALAKEQGVEGG